MSLALAATARRTAPADFLGPLTEFEAKNAPETIFACGELDLLKRGPKVSIVGSRDASEDGLRRARSLAGELVRREVIVVSGLAAGIDAAAHRGAIDAGGKTIAVLGTALDRAYPASNAELQETIMREHLAISQFAPGTAVRRFNFPIRNRLMALISDATVIVEAGETSGTLHQGWEAIRLGRPLFLMESVVSNSQLAWPRKMMEYGAQILSRSNLDLVVENLPSFTHDNAPAFRD